MEEELDLGAMLEGAVEAENPEMVSTEETPEPSPTDGEQVATPQPEIQEEPVQQQQMDNSVLTEQLNQQSVAMQEMAKQINDMTNNIPKPEAPQPTEEDVLRNQMKKDLGLDKIEAQYQKQQELIDAQNKQIELQQQAEIARSRDA